MGGYGSTRWLLHTTKETVEDSYALNVRNLVGRIIPRRVFDQRISWQGSIIWRRGEQQTGSAGYTLLFREAGPELTLFYTVTRRNGEKQQYAPRIKLITTRCNYGGVRYWFECPWCRRRVGAIYSPPSDSRYACRHCHKLTYAAQQDRRHYGGLLGGYVTALDRVTKFEKLWEKLQRSKKLTPRQAAFLKAEFGLLE